jgi:hypothetical protein
MTKYVVLLRAIIDAETPDEVLENFRDLPAIEIMRITGLDPAVVVDDQGILRKETT